MKTLDLLFHRAMALPEGRRERFLREHALDPEIGQQLIKMVRVSSQADDFLQTSIGLPDLPPTLIKGDVVGVWQVEQRLGFGGMGEVFEVRRCDDTYSQHAALKVMRTSDSHYLEAFEFERQALARLEHANIGRLIDGGRLETGFPFMVMELIDGRVITDHVTEKCLNRNERLDLFQQVLNAVSHAHGRLVLHRDIKPSNIMVSSDGLVKLIDFGVAGSLTANHVDAYPLTRQYAAPELLIGGAATIASDVYALGCVLYEICSGEIWQSNVSSHKNMNADLHAIVARSTAPDPSDRYASVELLKADYERFRRGGAVEARNGGRIYRAQKVLRRYLVASVALVLFMLSLIIGTVVSIQQMNAARVAQAEAKAASLEREFEARTLRGYAYGLEALYGGSEADGDRLDPDAIDRSMIKIARQTRDRFDGASLDDAFLLYSMSQVLMSRYDFENAILFLEPLLSLASDEEMARHLRLEAQSDLARSWVELGKTEKAISAVTTLISEKEDTGNVADSAYFQDLVTLSTLKDDPETRERAIRAFETFIDDPQFLTMSSDEASWFHNQLGWLLFSGDEVSSALVSFEKAFELSRAKGISSLSDVTTATNIAQLQIYFGWDGEKPLEYLSDYAEIGLAEFGAEDVYGFIQGLRAEAALLLRDWSLADEAAEKGLPFLQNDRSFRDGWYYEMIVMRVRAMVQLGNRGDARHLLHAASADFSSEPDRDGWGFTECKLRMITGYLLAAEGSFAQSQTHFDDGLELCKARSSMGWDNEKVLPRWAADLKREMVEFSG